eukprot:1380208-Prymnesium_polylepis.1
MRVQRVTPKRVDRCGDAEPLRGCLEVAARPSRQPQQLVRARRQRVAARHDRNRAAGVDRLRYYVIRERPARVHRGEQHASRRRHVCDAALLVAQLPAERRPAIEHGRAQRARRTRRAHVDAHCRPRRALLLGEQQQQPAEEPVAGSEVGHSLHVREVPVQANGNLPRLEQLLARKRGHRAHHTRHVAQQGRLEAPKARFVGSMRRQLRPRADPAPPTLELAKTPHTFWVGGQRTQRSPRRAPRGCGRRHRRPRQTHERTH